MTNDQLTQDAASALSEQERIRLEKLKALQNSGEDPYLITKCEASHCAQEITD